MGEQMQRRERKVATGVFYMAPEDQQALQAELAHPEAGDGAQVVVHALRSIASHIMMDVQELRTAVGKHQLAIGDRFCQLENRVAASLRADLQARQEIALLRQAVAANNALVAEQARVMGALLARLNKPKPHSALEQARTWLNRPGSKLVAAACVSLFVTLSIAVYAVVLALT